MGGVTAGGAGGGSPSRARHGGAAGTRPCLLLLHGLGATAQVWTPLTQELERCWPGRWTAVDLPGHGGSSPLPRVSFGALAAAVAQDLPRDEPVVALGHSLGGVVALALASGWFGVEVSAVVGLGIKVSWTAEELQRAAALAERPVSWFATRDEAAQRHLRVAGLAGLVDPDDPSLSAALVEHDGRWRLALDPASFAVGRPDLPGLLAAARAPVLLARGDHDALVSTDQLAELVPAPVVLPGCGHNAHLERPAAVARLLDDALPLR